ncbi:AraC family transcriptional regulator [Paenibacillus thiaminolyticus]|uniref:AraC family transcriptional regulator n=1 Tax=Paenibacillus thiaminolyticus TaxID=49283 RepID=A0A3A3GBK1_PANTH|nr:AraC family transcriptional regulator [Paenibacillus thiaminolyticus]RJG20617.1 AraC family transcriptional regulator [Paenibacillus thiaminolyticus]
MKPPLEEVHKLANMLGTDHDKELRDLLYDLFDQDKLIEYGIAYLEELRGLVNGQVIDDVFRVYGAAPADLLAGSRGVCAMFRFSDAQTNVKALEQFLLNLSRNVSKVRQAHSGREEMKEAIFYIREHCGKPLTLTMAMVPNHVSLSYTYVFQRGVQAVHSFVNDVKKLRLEEAKRMLDRRQNCGHQPPGLRACQATLPRF